MPEGRTHRGRVEWSGLRGREEKSAVRGDRGELEVKPPVEEMREEEEEDEFEEEEEEEEERRASCWSSLSDIVSDTVAFGSSSPELLGVLERLRGGMLDE